MLRGLDTFGKVETFHGRQFCVNQVSADIWDVLVPRTLILVTPLSMTGIMTTTPARSSSTSNGKSTAIHGSKSRGEWHSAAYALVIVVPIPRRPSDHTAYELPGLRLTFFKT